MPINEDQLIQGLNNYHEKLAAQTGAIASALDELQGSFHALWQEYEGDGADRVQTEWRRTAESLESCVNTSRQLEVFLEEKIGVLEENRRQAQNF